MELNNEISNEQEELKAFRKTLLSFWQYEEFAIREHYQPRYDKWMSLSDHQKALLPNDYLYNLDQIKSKIHSNAEFYKDAVLSTAETLGFDLNYLNDWEMPSTSDMNKTCSILVQVYREFSAACQEERNILLSRIQALLNDIGQTDDKLTILVPGVGIGRLIVDLCILAGSTATVISNEYSLHMLTLSMFLLNGNLDVNQYTIYPFIHSFSHWDMKSNQLKGYSIPDIDISSQNQSRGGLNMEMRMGSFADCFGPNVGIQESSQYTVTPDMRLKRAEVESSIDIVITNFFIDTGFNILDYMETITHALKPGGHWVNFGPLLYHFENDANQETVYETNPYTNNREIAKPNTPLKGLELATMEILDIATTKLNYKIKLLEQGIPSGYGKSESLIHIPGYLCNYWVIQLQE
ncbi:hypothetical protein TPHA_0P00940 [Tetrapisispora phaffii CBS 4417]|uniref:carnosine N-methyltransferase n=1 Tax=Tetrapisispora phaffii (strain ATCC 24235 / CBS 4417 / NBRC 1672 / NRRL Y-8282 / UCD 70-5) TaxID=1071381 RepID=G8C274_TETPH|nr:hypothetical protein TPHA_0P00940 [Tetrapisispora phaffii CBS 4417]CCE66252.1 hypothetical protein TPHA_0P00940 [Tetrapisispora phaffii CBS 4417]